MFQDVADQIQSLQMWVHSNNNNNNIATNFGMDRQRIVVASDFCTEFYYPMDKSCI